ncbi:MAG: 1-(5-phosphoribosyl)-5-[(5-phosphoribosylamino)methylideneamino]imidazole-4-carboxamide isomerase [Candidatus Sumerlaeaceae bacterium]|nr:1-(5-phosphoribosyl)-5-[(5-phosphoribosylamino)methylideneamino]imidazole-4-carboxamide isomerase [Candidatus Sumerlaeaceae bacterium]
MASDTPTVKFLVIPAIDLMGGACVRLEQGDSNRRTRYSVDAVDVARQFERDGARRIHVVDLDGAFEGTPRNLTTIKKIREATTVEIEVGGGIRDEETVLTLFDAGINYVILGTKALEEPEFLRRMVDRYGDRIIVGADARDGLLSTRGWTKTLEVRATDYLRSLLTSLPKLTVIYTDIARDGMFSSPNYAALIELLDLGNIDVIASGGVGALDDIAKLRALNKPNLHGVIVGKALYDGRVCLSTAVAQFQSS